VAPNHVEFRTRLDSIIQIGEDSTLTGQDFLLVMTDLMDTWTLG